jgi:hypothetical protein
MKSLLLKLLIVLAAIVMSTTEPKASGQNSNIGAYAYSSFPDLFYLGAIPMYYWPPLEAIDFSGAEINPAEDCDSGCDIVCAAFIFNNTILTVYSKTMP